MNAAAIVECLLDAPSAAGLTGKQLMESPQYFPGSMAYQKDSKFRPIGAGNFGTFTVIEQDSEFVYAINPQLNTGFVFTATDVANPPKIGMTPVLYVQLRKTGIKGYLQAHHLRIRHAYAQQGVATRWYMAYVHRYGGIVSDFEHLEGGKRLWRMFVNTATARGFKISLVDTVTGTWTPLGVETPDSTVWSLDASKRELVLVLEQ